MSKKTQTATVKDAVVMQFGKPDVSPTAIEERRQLIRPATSGCAARALAKALLAMRQAEGALRELRAVPQAEMEAACDIGNSDLMTGTAQYIRGGLRQIAGLYND